MKRHTGQKALYEAIAKTQAKSRRQGILERLHPVDGKPPEPAVEEPEIQAKPVEEPVEEDSVVVEQPVVVETAPVIEKPLVQEKPIVVEKPPAPAVRPLRPVERVAPPASPSPTWLRPKAVQLHDGRIEISVPYTVGVTVALVTLFVVVGAFWLGQMDQRAGMPASETGSGAAKAPEQPVNMNPPAPATTTQARQAAPGNSVGAPANPAGSSTTSATQQGDHVIVLAQHANTQDLEAVRQYYLGHAVPTEVISKASLRTYLSSVGLNPGLVGSGDGYMLVTRNYYSNPANVGSDGYKAKQKIAELGLGYKAPPGRDSFAPHRFGDAYGMKIQ